MLFHGGINRVESFTMVNEGAENRALAKRGLTKTPRKADVMDQPPSHLFDSMTAPRPRPTLAAAMLVAVVAALPFVVLAGVQFLF
jgi:hypothetical protein